MRDDYAQAWLTKGENRGEWIKSFIPAIQGGDINLFRIMKTRRERLEGKPDYRGFCNYLSASKSFGATDARDRAYALLGLATDVDSSSFPVSYSESTEEISMRVARYLIQNGDGVYALYDDFSLAFPVRDNIKLASKSPLSSRKRC